MLGNSQTISLIYSKQGVVFEESNEEFFDEY